MVIQRPVLISHASGLDKLIDAKLKDDKPEFKNLSLIPLTIQTLPPKRTIFIILEAQIPDIQHMPLGPHPHPTT